MAKVGARENICQSIGIESVLQAHEIIVAGASREPSFLLHKGLNARILTELGYDAPGMTRLGYKPNALHALGYAIAGKAQVPDNAAKDSEEILRADPRGLIAKGYRATDLSQAGITLHHCRTAGIPARELHRIGFSMNELAIEFSATELRLIGFNPRELGRILSGPQLRAAGFSSSEMRLAGYGVKDLLRFGYSENHVRTAGYSVNELAREGLSRLIEDKRKKN